MQEFAKQKVVATYEDAISWVDGNKGKVIRKAEKFRAYGTYDMDDYIQQAYTAAFDAVDTILSGKKQDLKFEAAFWVIYKAQLDQMASIPNQEDVLGAGHSLAPCIHESYSEEYDGDDNPPTPVCSNLPDPLSVLLKSEIVDEEKSKERHRIKMLMHALSVMTEKQRQVWLLLLEPRRPTTEQVAKRLGKTRQGVEQLRDYGIDRVIEEFSKDDSIPSDETLEVIFNTSTVDDFLRERGKFYLSKKKKQQPVNLTSLVTEGF